MGIIIVGITFILLLLGIIAWIDSRRKKTNPPDGFDSWDAYYKDKVAQKEKD